MENKSVKAVLAILKDESITSFQELEDRIGIAKAELDFSDLEYIREKFQNRRNSRKKLDAMIDASIVNIDYESVFQEYRYIYVSDVTIDELNHLKDKRGEKNSLIAQALLRLIWSQKGRKIRIVSVVKHMKDRDMAIILTTLDMLNQNLMVELITSDTGMAQRAYEKDVPVRLFESRKGYHSKSLIPIADLSSDGIIKDTEMIKFLVVDYKGNQKKQPCKLSVDDRIFIVSSERIREKMVSVFKEVVPYKDYLEVRKKIIFFQEDEIDLETSYQYEERALLENFIQGCREAFYSNNK